MPLYGTLDLATVAGKLPTLPNLDTEAWVLPRAETMMMARRFFWRDPNLRSAPPKSLSTTVNGDPCATNRLGTRRMRSDRRSCPGAVDVMTVDPAAATAAT